MSWPMVVDDNVINIDAINYLIRNFHNLIGALPFQSVNNTAANQQLAELPVAEIRIRLEKTASHSFSCALNSIEVAISNVFDPTI